MNGIALTAGRASLGAHVQSATRFLKKNPLLLAIALFAMLDVMFSVAFGADAAQIFKSATNKTQDIFYNGRNIVLVLCGIAFVATMLFAMTGRFPTGKAIAISGAIFAVGIAAQAVSYFAETSTVSASSTSPTDNMTDTND